jgi:hypothetical protein
MNRRGEEKRKREKKEEEERRRRREREKGGGEERTRRVEEKEEKEKDEEKTSRPPPRNPPNRIQRKSTHEKVGYLPPNHPKLWLWIPFKLNQLQVYSFAHFPFMNTSSGVAAVHNLSVA